MTSPAKSTTSGISHNFDLARSQFLPPPKVSFEFSPPRTTQAEHALWQTIDRLAPLAPQFVSVTYGAGGSTRDRTHDTVRRLHQEKGLPAAAHLTCVGASRNDVDEVISAYKQAGISHIVALRGDPPTGVGTKFEPHPDGYLSSVELIKGIKQIGDFEISVSAYPEKHPDAANMDEDIDLLRRKVEAGATRAITQFVFDTEKIVAYRDRINAAGIDIPLVPGIMPVNSFVGIKRFATNCGASIPDWLSKLFDSLEDDPQTHSQVAAIVAAEQCVKLREFGFDQFHFYTLNKPELTYSVCHVLGLRPNK